MLPRLTNEGCWSFIQPENTEQRSELHYFPFVSSRHDLMLRGEINTQYALWMNTENIIDINLY